MSLIIDPHNKKSRLIKSSDYDRVLSDSQRIIQEAFSPTGIFRDVYSVAHPQITDRDPLRFFVLRDKTIVMNPIILNHTKTTVDSLEACLSFPSNFSITVQRWNKCVVRYEKLNFDKTVEVIEANLNGLEAKIFQHEIDHLDAIYIYEQ
jgi:peptide deformylase